MTTSINSSFPWQSASDSSVTVTTEVDSTAQKMDPPLDDGMSCTFSPLETGGHGALSTACKELGTPTCGELGTLVTPSTPSRCQVLLASDTKRHLFTSFGIECPEGGAASLERMQAMVSRTECVLGSLAAFSEKVPHVELPKSFPKFPLTPHTADRLVMDLPPEQLQELLAVVYDCSLYTLFAPHAKVAPNDTQYAHAPHLPAISLAAATQGIQRWLRTEAAKKVLAIEPREKALACLPAEIGQLSGLYQLKLNGQWLATLPAELGLLTTLQGLTLNNNQLKEIPSSVGQLSKLSTLFLSGNQLKETPSCIGQLTKLRYLCLDHNQLKEIPSCIGQLTKLTALYLDHNQLKEIPSCVGQLTKLQGLFVGSNQLVTLPKGLGRAAALKHLRLSYNPLKSIPAEITQLPGLTELCLDKEQCAEFQSQLKGLQKRGVVTLDCLPVTATTGADSAAQKTGPALDEGMSCNVM